MTENQSYRIYRRNIRLLGIELYKPRNTISSHIMNEYTIEIYSTIFDHQTDFTIGPICNNGLKSLRYLGPKIWNIITPDIRTIISEEN